MRFEAGAKHDRIADRVSGNKRWGGIFMPVESFAVASGERSPLRSRGEMLATQDDLRLCQIVEPS